MNKSELFDHINELTGHYYGDKQASDFYSREEFWLMFPEKSVANIEAGKKSPLPNIYINDTPATKSLTDPMADQFFISLSYANKPAVDWLLGLMEMANAKNRGMVQKICSEFPDSWTYIWKKTKLVLGGYVYLDERKYQTSICELSAITSEIQSLRRDPVPTLIDDKQVIWQTPIIDLIRFEPVSLIEFDETFKKVWEAFQACLTQQIGKSAKIGNIEVAELVSKYKIAVRLSRSRDNPPDLQQRYADIAKSYKKILKEKYGIDPDKI